MGPEGLEPSRRWLRARYAAASTLVQYLSKNNIPISAGPEEERHVPLGLHVPLDRRSSSGLAEIEQGCCFSTYPQIGSEGFEPSPHRLKGEYAAVTPRPCESARRAFMGHDDPPPTPISPYGSRTHLDGVKGRRHHRTPNGPCA